MILKSLYKQQNDLVNNHPEGVKILINPDDYLDIQAEISGPENTPYEGGIFHMKLIISKDFPITPPKGVFSTKIFHPNVSPTGEICVNTLKKDWNPKQWSIYHILQVVRCLLIIPFPESSLNEEAGRLFQENYDEYFKLAQLYTKVHSKNSKNDPFELKHGLDGNSNWTNIRNNSQFINIKEPQGCKRIEKAEYQQFEFENLNENRKPSRSQHVSQKAMNDLICQTKQKLSMNNFSSAGSIKVSVTPSKSKQEEIKKWMARI